MLPAGWQGSTDASWSGDMILVGAGNDTTPNGAMILIDTLGNLIDQVLLPDDNWASFGYPSWSPDMSKFLLNVSYIDGQGFTHGDFRLYSIDGSLDMILAEEAGAGEWSPDGSKIVFQKYTFMGHNPDPLEIDYGRVTIWVCNADGSDMHELLGWPQPEYDTTMFDGGHNWLTDTYGP
jgi:Tol biopolymer transport system component